MMRGLLARTWRETRLTTLGFTVAVGGVTGIITLVLPQLLEGLNDFMLQVPFLRSMISAMMGIDIGAGLTTTMLLSIMWTHPAVLALVWAHEIVLCTRYPAGEIERGTIDVLLGWPVSRRAALGAETIVWLLSGATIVLAALTGYAFASLAVPPELRPPFARAAFAALNLFALYVAAAGVTTAAAAVFDRRGHAIAVGFAVVAASFLLNFLAQFWRPAETIRFLGLMDYYRPAIILRDGGFPVADTVVLASVGLMLWVAAMEITARRDIRTT